MSATRRNLLGVVGTGLLLLILMTAVGVGPGQGRADAAVPAPYKGIEWGWCTWYAAVEFDKTAPAPGKNWYGYATDWLANARSAGWRTSTNPGGAQVGAIVVWQGGQVMPGYSNGAGHVAIVRQVTSTQIVVQEMNFKGFGVVSSATLRLTSLNRGSLRFAGYILPGRAVPYWWNWA